MATSESDAASVTDEALLPEGDVWKEFIGMGWRKLDETPYVVWITSGGFIELTILFARRHHERALLQLLLQSPPRMTLERVVYFAFPVDVVKALLSWGAPVIGKPKEERVRLEHYAKVKAALLSVIEKTLLLMHPEHMRTKFIKASKDPKTFEIV